MGTIRARASASLATLGLAATLTAASFVTAAPASASMTSSERQMASYINHSRATRGLRTLALSGVLGDISRRHSAAMARAGRIYHTSSLGNTLRTYSWTWAGENVGRGTSMWSLHEAFMASPAHRENILFRRFNKVGVGVVWSGGRAYVTETFLG